MSVTRFKPKRRTGGPAEPPRRQLTPALRLEAQKIGLFDNLSYAEVRRRHPGVTRTALRLVRRGER